MGWIIGIFVALLVLVVCYSIKKVVKGYKEFTKEL